MGSGARDRLQIHANPFRSAIMSCLVMRPMSAVEVAEQIDATPEQVRHQIRRLRAANLVLAAGRTRRRGPEETLYKAADPSVFALTAADLSAVRPDSVEPALLRLVTTMWREAKEALEAGVIESWEQPINVTRIPLALDAEGWEAARGLLVESVAAITRLLQSSPNLDNEVAHLSEMRFVLTFLELPFGRDLPGDLGRLSAGGSENDAEVSPTHRWKVLTPTRLRILTLLGLRPSTTAEVAEILDLPPAAVRAELNMMRRGGSVHVHGQGVSGNAVEYVYSSDPEKLPLFEEEVREVAPHHRARFFRTIITSMFGDLTAAIQTGALTRSDDYVIASIPALVDARLEGEIREVLESAFFATMRFRAESLERLRTSGEAPVIACTSLLNFPMPPRPDAKRADRDAADP